MQLEVHAREFEEGLDYIMNTFPSPHKVVSWDHYRNEITFDVLNVTQEQQDCLSDWVEKNLVSCWHTSDTPQDTFPYATLVQEILATPVHQVPSNGNTRYYMEPEADKRWDRRHHLIDLNGDSGPMSSFLSLAEFSSGIESSSVQHINLSYNEVDELLAILLQWRVGHEDKRIEDTKPENALGDLDAHPF